MSLASSSPAVSAGLDLARQGSDLRLALSGAWTLRPAAPAPTIEVLTRAFETAVPARLVFEAPDLDEWDSVLVTFVYAVVGLAHGRGIEVDLGGLPMGVQRLVALAGAVPGRLPAPPAPDDAMTARVGRIALRACDTLGDAVSFLGETLIAFAALSRGRARFRRDDLLAAVEATGPAALGIVALINFLIGAVLAFVGAVQLQPFGATIYVASLVAIGVTRELGALMTGIVMAGRTGASYAAVLGTMTVNEEVDALRTMGLRPVEFLVLPRVVATACMLPALVAYADLMGMMGGLFVGVTMLGLGASEYARQSQEALALRHVVIGLAKGSIFGVVVVDAIATVFLHVVGL
ncbi:MAG TPA: ABC transporter permease [Vicinamibacteria bacterium]